MTLRSGTPAGSCVRMPSLLLRRARSREQALERVLEVGALAADRHGLLALEEVDVDGRGGAGVARDARREQPEDQNEPRDPGAREAMTHHEPGILPATGVPRTGKL